MSSAFPEINAWIETDPKVLNEQKLINAFPDLTPDQYEAILAIINTSETLLEEDCIEEYTSFSPKTIEMVRTEYNHQSKLRLD